jgi:glucose-1-phosphate thymidylyltransferase
MKGVILAGGLGTRLSPLTKITNKHLLPIYDRPMIHYPLRTLTDAGIRDVLIVTGGNHAGEFLRLLGNGREYGLNEIAYAYQEGEGGIADALALARPFAKGDRIVVVLGDNIIEGDIRRAVAAFAEQPKGARILLKKVGDPERFGVPVFEAGRITAIEEKPRRRARRYAVIGVYMCDATVFE